MPGGATAQSVCIAFSARRAHSKRQIPPIALGPSTSSERQRSRVLHSLVTSIVPCAQNGDISSALDERRVEAAIYRPPQQGPTHDRQPKRRTALFFCMRAGRVGLTRQQLSSNTITKSLLSFFTAASSNPIGLPPPPPSHIPHPRGPTRNKRSAPPLTSPGSYRRAHPRTATPDTGTQDARHERETLDPFPNHPPTFPPLPHFFMPHLLADPSPGIEPSQAAVQNPKGPTPRFSEMTQIRTATAHPSCDPEGGAEPTLWRRGK